MNVATLGPAGTFAEMATRKYLEETSKTNEIKYYSSIKLALAAIGGECEAAVIPIENFSEGFIPSVLDILAKEDLFIIHEVILPIQFSFVSNCPTIEDITKVFCQFVAKGQCSEFLSTLEHVKEISTQSNMESLKLLEQEQSPAGAVVPAHVVVGRAFSKVIRYVNDCSENQTRFIAVSTIRNLSYSQHSDEYKTSVIVYGNQDYPGLLGDILSSFSARRINITSLISRPSGKKFGQYHFFIDATGHDCDLKLKEAIKEVRSKCSIKLLGSYKAASVNCGLKIRCCLS